MVLLNVKLITGGSFEIEVDTSLTVRELKKLLAAHEACGIGEDRQRVIYSGSVLKDDEVLSSKGRPPTCGTCFELLVVGRGRHNGGVRVAGVAVTMGRFFFL